MQRIEYYTDYRAFLRDYYEDRKKRFPFFSYRYFCGKAGIKSPSLFRDVVCGKRNLTGVTIAAFAKGLQLTDSDAQFFTALVRFNQTTNAQEKQLLLERMRGLTRKVRRETIPVDRYEYYAKWYHVVLRELACLRDWGDDFAALARAVRPRITKREAREGVRFLLDRGFLARTPEGRYRQTQPAITSGSEVASLGIRAFNRYVAQRAVEAIEEYSPAERDIRSMVIGISANGYRLLKQEIQEFCQRIARIADDDLAAGRVYNVNIHLFPLSMRTDTAEEAPGEVNQ